MHSEKTRAEIQALSIEGLCELVLTQERIIEDLQRVLKACPPCSLHGDTCIPNAISWIKEQRERERSWSDNSLPTLGVIVHYVVRPLPGQGLNNESHTLEESAAIIVNTLGGGDAVNLIEIQDDISGEIKWRGLVIYSKDKAPGTWHYMED